MAKQLQPLNLVAPAFMGLNKDFSGSLLGPEWAVEARNAVVDRSGRLASRKGWVSQTEDTIPWEIEGGVEFIKDDGTTEIVSAANNQLYSGFQTFSNITGTLTITGDAWQFLNFRGKLIGVQTGHTPWVYDGAGDAEEIVAASGTVPTGHTGLAAYGRLWIVDSDGVTIKYSGLLDETDWGSASSGSIDMSKVWTNGTDRVVALAALGATLVVFGTRHIVMWVDGTGSELGLDPSQMYVVDTIEGTGCICRDSLQVISEGDILFLSPNGVQSIKRVLQSKNNPLTSVAPQVRNYINGFLSEENLCDTRSVYSPQENFYLLALQDANRTFAFDVREIATKGFARVTEWPEFSPKAMIYRDDTSLFFGFDGQYGKYDGYLDNGEPYRFVYRSGWLDLTDTFGNQLTDRNKILKSLHTLVFLQVNDTVIFKWAFDFDDVMRSKSARVTSNTASLAEFGLAEWGEGEWAGGRFLKNLHVNASGSGQFTQLGLEYVVNGSSISLQQLTMKAKIGRLA